ncbi:Hsp20/alpha crystallin family protein [Metabacillus herbersteinensis]|uniref:Hsp20/alpha crystallin family protein n=1 Tax=Metabacillus herbersteinensis TaxID=283816 RepID=A0ABV6GMG8_9BACI
MFPWNKQFPFQGTNSTDSFKNMKPAEVEGYIQNVMKNVFGGDFSSSFPFQGDLPSHSSSGEKNQGSIKSELFETSEYVYVRLPINAEQIQSIRIQHTNSQLLLLNYPNDGKERKFMLPSTVKRKGTKAVVTNGMLEIRFIKHEDHHISEIEIRNQD